MNKICKTLCCIGFVVLLATAIIVSISINNWEGITPFAVGSIIWAEIAFFVGLIGVEILSKRTEQIITRSIGYTVFSIYSCLTFILGLMNIRNHDSSASSFWILNIVMSTIAVVILIISVTASKRVYQSNAKTADALASFNSTLYRMNQIVDALSETEYKNVYAKLAEDFRYTDSNGTVSADKKIADILDSVEAALSTTSPSWEDISRYSATLKAAINERKNQISLSKRGKI